MYTVHGKDGGLAHGLATILPRKGYAGSDPVEAYVVFAANMDKGAGLSRIAMLPEEHRALGNRGVIQAPRRQRARRSAGQSRCGP